MLSRFDDHVKYASAYIQYVTARFFTMFWSSVQYSFRRCLIEPPTIYCNSENKSPSMVGIELNRERRKNKMLCVWNYQNEKNDSVVNIKEITENWQFCTLT